MAKFTVVTACRNAVRYIEETVKSALSQSIFLSEPDNGFYAALAKGSQRATGDDPAYLDAEPHHA
jgi:glycosyltransferase involved in cell wall biosynthesis